MSAIGTLLAVIAILAGACVWLALDARHWRREAHVMSRWVSAAQAETARAVARLARPREGVDEVFARLVRDLDLGR